MERKYTIFTFKNTGMSLLRAWYALIDTRKTFDTYSSAEQWIKEKGDRGKAYVILEILKRR